MFSKKLCTRSVGQSKINGSDVFIQNKVFRALHKVIYLIASAGCTRFR